MTKTRTKLFIMILIGYLKLKIVYFVLNLWSNQQNVQERTSVSDEEKMKIVALEQKRRVDHIRKVCDQWKKAGQSKVIQNWKVDINYIELINILEKKCLDKRSFWQITSSIWQWSLAFSWFRAVWSVFTDIFTFSSQGKQKHLLLLDS